MKSNINVSPVSCSLAFEEAVNRFLDGELPFDEQPAVFSHLARCPDCRRMVDGVLRFRSVSRRERIRVPPAVDRAFFKRLEQHKRKNLVTGGKRRSLWNTRRLVSLKSAVIAAIVLVSLGLLLPMAVEDNRSSSNVHGVTEQVEFRDVIYVIYPGVTVEAAKVEL